MATSFKADDETRRDSGQAPPSFKPLRASGNVLSGHWAKFLLAYNFFITFLFWQSTYGGDSLKILHSSKSCQQKLWSPFQNGVEYIVEHSQQKHEGNGLFFGEPSRESEKAWNNLIHPNRRHGIRLYRDEAARMNISQSIELTDGNFAVILSVHHNLHCLRRLRQVLYAEEYYPDWTEEQIEHDRKHSLHCLESIRSSLVCQPDLSPMPYYWSNDATHRMNAQPARERECVNWEAFSQYLVGRSYEDAELIRDFET